MFRYRVTPALATILLVGTFAAGISTIASASDVDPVHGYQMSVIGGHLNVVSGTPATSNLIGPIATAVDKDGNIFIADYTNGLVEKVTPDGALVVIAGSGDRTGNTVAGPARSAAMDPRGVAVDALGNVYIGDSRGYIDKVTPNGMLSILARSNVAGAPPLRGYPIAVDGPGNVYVGDQWSGLVYRISTTGNISKFAGNGRGGDAPSNGPALDSRVSPIGLATDSAGALYIASAYYGHTPPDHGFVARVTPAGTLTVIGGNGLGGAPEAGPATSSPLNPTAVTVDAAGNVVVADVRGYVDRIAPDGALSVMAGNGVVGKPVEGAALSSPMQPTGLAADSAGNFYIAGSGYIAEVTPASQLTLVAGGGAGNSALIPGPATSSPLGGAGTAMDGAGNIYVADAGHHAVEKIAPDGTISVVAGDGVSGAPSDGPATSRHVSPNSIAVEPDGTLYIGDAYEYVERVTPDGTMTLVAGDGVNAPPTNGQALSTNVVPNALAVDDGGNLYIADQHGYVSKVTPAGVLTIVAGNGKTTPSPTAGPATASALDPRGLAVAPDGSLYVSSYGYLVQVGADGQLAIVFNSAGHSGPLPSYYGATIHPTGIGIGPDGTLYIGDATGYLLALTSTREFSIVGGNGAQGAIPVAGPALSSPMSPVNSLAVDPNGNVVFTAMTSAGPLLLKVTPPRALTTQPAGLSITTPVHVGVPASAKIAGAWTAGGAALTPKYQWYRVYLWNGEWTWEIIPGATASSYTPPWMFSGSRLGVKATAVSPIGYEAASTVTSGTTVIGPGTLTTSAPSVRGVARAGARLQAVSGVWKAGSERLPGSGTMKYQWFANGRLIRGADKQSFRPSRAFLGKMIRVRVTGSHWGYVPASRFSLPVRFRP